MPDDQMPPAPSVGSRSKGSNITSSERSARTIRRIIPGRSFLLAVLAGLMATSGCDRYEWDSEKQQIKYRFTHPWEGLWTSKVDTYHYFVIHTIASAEGELRSDGALTIQNEWHDRTIVSMEDVEAVDGGIRFSTGKEYRMGPPASSIKDAIVDAAIDIAIDRALSADPDRREMFFDGTNLYEWDGQDWFVVNKAPFVRGTVGIWDDTYSEEQ